MKTRVIETESKRMTDGNSWASTIVRAGRKAINTSVVAFTPPQIGDDLFKFQDRFGETIGEVRLEVSTI